MKIQLEVNNLTKSPVPDSFFVSVAKTILNKADFKFLKNKKVIISLALIAPKEIKKINRTYRKNNKVTDILSFAEYNQLAAIKKDKNKEIFLGELIVCYDNIKRYALENKLPFKKELVEVFSHGLLHLLGFNHGKKMFDLQKELTRNQKGIKSKNV